MTMRELSADLFNPSVRRLQLGDSLGWPCGISSTGVDRARGDQSQRRNAGHKEIVSAE
jgi:hypothetical protein